MQYEKKVIASLEKCYSIATLSGEKSDGFLVAAEKHNRCILFNPDGKEQETVWNEPGGVMTMEQVPGRENMFLATHRFYSPNDSADASIVVAQRGQDGWRVHTLTKLPFVHRFGILTGKDGTRYLLAATLKSAHAFKNDWTCPGRAWVAPLPEDLSIFSDENPLKMEPLLSGLYKNHGFCKTANESAALIGTQNGVYRVDTPETAGGEWHTELLLEQPTSDMVLTDLDGDGTDELITYSPFHGETLAVYRKNGDSYEKAWQCDRPLEFLHAIWGGNLNGIPTVLVGHRKGDRDLMALTYDHGYHLDVIDHDVGPANVLVYRRDNKDCIISANREIDQIALYIPR